MNGVPRGVYWQSKADSKTKAFNTPTQTNSTLVQPFAWLHGEFGSSIGFYIEEVFIDDYAILLNPTESRMYNPQTYIEIFKYHKGHYT